MFSNFIGSRYSDITRLVSSKKFYAPKAEPIFNMLHNEVTKIRNYKGVEFLLTGKLVMVGDDFKFGTLEGVVDRIFLDMNSPEIINIDVLYRSDRFDRGDSDIIIRTLHFSKRNFSILKK